MEGHHHQQPSSLEDRPSFSSWRKNEEATKAKSLTFIQTDPGQLGRKASTATQSTSAEPGQQQQRQPASPPTTSTSPRSNNENSSGNSNSSTSDTTDKRRAQVRRAQLQHRARKAEYVRQLEADIEAMRARIEGAERDRRALQEANEGFRARIRGVGGGGVDGGVGLPLPAGAVVSADDDVLRQQQDQQWTCGFGVGSSGGHGNGNGGGGFPGLGDRDAVADADGPGLDDLSFYTGSAPDPMTMVMSGSPLFGSPSPAYHQYSSGGHLEQLLFAYNSSSNSGHDNISGDSTPYLDLMLPDMSMNDIYTASSSSTSSYEDQAGRDQGQGQVMMDLSLYP